MSAHGVAGNVADLAAERIEEEGARDVFERVLVTPVEGRDGWAIARVRSFHRAAGTRWGRRPTRRFPASPSSRRTWITETTGED